MAFANSNPIDPGEPEDDGIQAQINITPLTDIFLVLLIIFMVTSTALTQRGMAVNLPQAKNSSSVPEKKDLVVTLAKNGAVLINNQPIDPNRMEEEFARQIGSNSDTTIVVQGDEEALLGQTVKILDAAKQAGATHIAIATKPLRQ